MYPTSYQYDVITDRAGLTWATGILSTAAHAYRALAVDTETTGLETLEHDLVLIQLATPDHAFLFPVGTGLDLRPIAKLLHDTDTTKIMQYAPFDWSYLTKEFGEGDLLPIFDTRKAAENLGLPAGKRGLKDLTMRYCHLSMSKEQQTSFRRGQELTEEQERYAAIDALALWPICLGMLLHGKPDIGRVTIEDLAPMKAYLAGGPWPSRPSPTPAPTSAASRGEAPERSEGRGAPLAASPAA